MNFLHGFLDCLCLRRYQEESPYSRRERCRLQAQELEKRYCLSKRSGEYGAQLMAFVGNIKQLEELNREPLVLSEFFRDEVVIQDVAYVRDIKYLIGQNNTETLRKKVIQAHAYGVPERVLDEIVGDCFDIECLTQEGTEGKFHAFTHLSENNCAICLEPYSPLDYVYRNVHRTVCHHFFHKSCYQLWTNLNPTCPTCRHPVVFTRESTRWNSYLETVHQRVVALFPHAEETRCDAADMVEDDEAFALRVHAEELEALQARDEQIRQDALFSMRLVSMHPVQDNDH